VLTHLTHEHQPISARRHGQRRHSPWKCCKVFFFALVVTVKRSVDRLFMHYFYNLSSASGTLPQTPTGAPLLDPAGGFSSPDPLICIGVDLTGILGGLTTYIKVLPWRQKYIFLHCNASNLVLKILHHDKICGGQSPAPNSGGMGGLVPRLPVIYAHANLPTPRKKIPRAPMHEPRPICC